MAQYINKDTVVEQLNIDLSNLHIAQEEGFLGQYGKGKLEGLDGILDFINNIDVKEVDLKKEVEAYKDTFWWDEDLYKFAKHFFELGIKVQKGE